MSCYIIVIRYAQLNYMFSINGIEKTNTFMYRCECLLYSSIVFVSVALNLYMSILPLCLDA